MNKEFLYKVHFIIFQKWQQEKLALLSLARLFRDSTWRYVLLSLDKICGFLAKTERTYYIPDERQIPSLIPRSGYIQKFDFT